MFLIDLLLTSLLKIFALKVLITSFLNQKGNEVELFYSAMNKNNYSEAIQVISNIENDKKKIYLKEYYNLFVFGKFNSKYNSDKSNDNENPILFLFNKGLYEYYHNGKETKSFKILNLALKKALYKNDKVLICEISKAILDIYDRFTENINDLSHKEFLRDYNNSVYNDFERKVNALYNYRIILKLNYETPSLITEPFNKVNSIITDRDPLFIRAKLLITNASFNLRVNRKYDIALKEISKAIDILKNIEVGYIEKEKKIASLIIKSVILYEKEEYLKSQETIDQIINLENDHIFNILKSHTLYWKYRIHTSLGNELDSLIHKSNYFERQHYLKHSKQIQLISEHKTIEKEKKISEQRYLLILASIVILLGIVITYLILKNSRRKRLLAEQQKNLEKQKNLTLLKEQEITAINAMIDGQEKERIRIAEDLHDNIGSVLATLKLHFENLQLNRNKKQFDQNILFQKTETLIDEAYLKIRSIAHAKNSGVIANQGLLVAVKLMADKISSANKIKINVIDFGLNNRLENSLEITLFRIIQELVTNVIKHAQASEVNINISQFDDHINLIVEDNGIGFIYNTIEHSQGMGLGSIEKRVEHFGGTFEIDSTKNKGTSVIIDFPINNT